MLTKFEEDQRTLDAMIQEGRRLAASMPRCHHMGNELQAVVLVAKMHAAGFPVTVADAAACIERMKIAAKAGVYPLHLLQASKAPGREMQEAV